MRARLALALLAASCLHAGAGDLTLEGDRIVTQAQATKGANCPSFSLELDEADSTVLWAVESSAESSYDFAKLEIPAEAQASASTVVTIDAQLELAGGSYLEIGLQLQDGRYFFANVRESSASMQSLSFPLSAMATADGEPFSGDPAEISGVVLMINSDASSDPGTSRLRLSRIVVGKP